SSMPWIRSSGLGHHVDRLAVGQLHVSLAPVAAAADAVAEGLALALHVDHVDGLDGDVEQLLDRGLDVRLGGGGRDFEHVLVGHFLQARGLLGDARRADHVIELRVVHASHSSICSTRAVVEATESAPTRGSGTRPCPARTSRYGRLRADRNTFSVATSVTTSGRWPTLSSASSATMPEVLGESGSKPSTTVMRP